MILPWLIVILLVGGLLAWLFGRLHPVWARWISLVALAADLTLGLVLWGRYPDELALSGQSVWLAEVNWSWIPRFGVSFHLAVDGLSLLMVLLTFFLGIMAVLASWSEIQERVGFFHFNLLWVMAGIVGVFLALDLFLFYFFWEVMLVPMYFLISIWGHENRVYAAIKFFIFTQASGLLMLLAILALVFIHYRQTGNLTFDYTQLLVTPLAATTQVWLMLGFFIAFAVKLPAVPLHTWLPDAHTEAPTAGSVILAGLLLKTGAYGLLRFVIPLFPEAARAFTPVAMVLGVVGILYGAVLAYAQTDVKRLVAYTSVSHLGFVLLGIFAWNELALQGAVMEMICHGISTGGLFILAGGLQHRLHTRELARMGGLWASAPRMGGAAIFFAMASLGLPGLGNFVAEFLVLAGSFQVAPVLTAVATVGLVIATVYSLRLVQHTFYGPNAEGWRVTDLSARDMVVVVAMMAVLMWLGLYPQAVLDTANPALTRVQHAAVEQLGTLWR
ncbi:MAG: NADH-quinone oxidoreductase subunit M [Candidatus Tectomicrobia bacterium]|nr:NADH-quinone oxidoreductase subunit M [Candidatus Tectomicrobia bacterium]